MRKPPAYLDLLGKPYRRDGRGPQDFDCYGLVKFVLEREGIRNLPNDPTPATTFSAIKAIEAQRPFWRQIASRPGAVVLLRDELAIGSHLGVVLDYGRFLHVSELRGQVVVERLSDPLWNGRVMGFYEPICEEVAIA